MRNRISRYSRQLAMLALSCSMSFVGASLSMGAEFPDKDVRIIVPAAPGGALDIISRLIAKQAADDTKKTFFVENKPGANWIIGMNAVAKSKPDGHTVLFIASSGVTVNPHVFANMPIDPLKDLVPLTLTTRTDFVLLVNPKIPARTIPEFVKYLKANAGKLNHASNSSTTMLLSELFRWRANVNYVDINFRGSALSMQDVIKGQSQFCFVDLGSATGPVSEKKLIPLGSTGAVRSPQRPDLPTIAEQGFPGFAVSSSTLLMVPAGTSKVVVDKLTTIFNAAVRNLNVKSRLQKMGQLVAGTTSKEALDSLVFESSQFKKIIKERKIKFGR